MGVVRQPAKRQTIASVSGRANAHGEEFVLCCVIVAILCPFFVDDGEPTALAAGVLGLILPFGLARFTQTVIRTFSAMVSAFS